MDRYPENKPTPQTEAAEARALLERGTRAVGLALSPVQVDQFLTYLELLLKWNRKMNLTALRAPEEIISRHFLDSLLLIPYLPEKGRLLDIGSGAGFPGLPLKIARPGLSVDLAEATDKKVSFLKEVIRCLGLQGIRVLPFFLGREPLPGPLSEPWEIFLSRGVKTETVVRALSSTWGPAQRLLLVKGPDGLEEMQRLETVLEKNRVELKGAYPVTNPLSQKKWTLVVLKKIAPTKAGE